MKLNLPILDHLKDHQNILIAGAGGGFDVFIGLPLYFTLRDLGKTVHLANYSFCDLELSQVAMKNAGQVLLKDRVLGVTGAVRVPLGYFPEGFLAQWFEQEHGQTIPIWMLAKTGVLPLIEGYRALTKHLKIDTIILVDGGVDSLMRGDETAPGTLLEDAISLAAVSKIDVPLKILMCGGFGTEVEEAVCHHHALENIAALTQAGGFWGTCSLLPQMPAFQLYESACRYVWEQPDHHKSHISTRIIPAAHGVFGDQPLYPKERRLASFISPLMSILWFFDAQVVIKHSLIIDLLESTVSTEEAFQVFVQYYQNTRKRPTQKIPY